MALVVKNLPANAGDIRDMSLIPGLGRSSGEGHGNPLHYSCLENPMDRGAWLAMVHIFAKSQTRLKQLRTHTWASEFGIKSWICVADVDLVSTDRHLYYGTWWDCVERKYRQRDKGTKIGPWGTNLKRPGWWGNRQGSRQTGGTTRRKQVEWEISEVKRRKSFSKEGVINHVKMSSSRLVTYAHFHWGINVLGFRPIGFSSTVMSYNW